MRMKHTILASVLMSCAAMAAGTTPEVRDQSIKLDIASQPLDEALNEFAQQAGLQLIYHSRVAKGLQSPRIVGTLTPRVALSQMLGNTGLQYEYLDANTVRIFDLQQTSNTPAARVAEMRLAQAPTEEASRVKADTSERRKADEGIPEMLVTGSKVLNMDIARSRDDTQPYVIFNREQIQNSQATNLEDFLKQRLTMNTQATIGAQQNGITGNVSQINLRGLGTNQTLILIDGHRAAGVAVFGTPGQTDINWIPLGAVERIEVLPTTASGIFGGSATGGAINIIMRRDYSGAAVDLNYENTFDTDAALRRVTLNGGFTLEEGKTSVLVSASYSDANRLAVRDRDFVRKGREIILQNNPAFILGAANPPLGATTNIRSTSGANLTLKNNNTALNSPYTFVPYGYGGPASDFGQALVANAGRYNFDPSDTSQQSSVGAGGLGIFTTPTVESAMTTIRRKFGDRVEGFIEASVANNKTVNPANFSTGVFVLPVSAPTNPFNQEIRVTAPMNSSLDSPYSSSTYTRRVVGGAIVRLPRQWRTELDYTWNQTGYKFFNSLNISPALASDVASGALNVIRDLSISPPDLSGYIGTTNNSIPDPLKSTLKDLAFRVGGPLFAMPAGPVSLTSLLEWREDTIGSVYQFTTASVVYRPDRSQDIYSAYVEGKVPLFSALNRRPGLEELELQVAARHDKYRLKGSDQVFQVASVSAPIPAITRNLTELSSTEPTVGLSYKPVKDLMLRASWGTGFFPPALTDLVPLASVSPATAAQTVVDPRRGNQPVVITYNMLSAAGGNPNLQPEDSESWSAGLVYTPRFLDGFRLSVDYTKIRKTNNIISVTYQDAVNYELFIPGRVTRGPVAVGDPYGVGPIVAIDVSRANLSRSYVEAYDIAADYAMDGGSAGTFDAFLQATVQTHLGTQASPAAPVLENVGIGSENPLKFKANAGLTWKRGPWSATWITRYFDSYLVANPAIASSAPTLLNQGNGGRVPSQMFHDVSAGYRFAAFGDNAASKILARSELRLGVKNIFNTEPEFDAATSPRYYSSFGDVRLASYWLSWKTEF